MKIESLKKKKDFDRIFSEKKSFGNRHYTLLYCHNDLDYSRIGIIVSKKISKKAVVRNHLRRQIREMFRLRQGRIAQGYDFIIIPRVRCTETDYASLSGSFDHVFFKAGLLSREAVV